MNWITPDTPVVILCAGKSKRFGGEVPKVLAEVAGKPLFQHVVDFWSSYSSNFTFIIAQDGELPGVPIADMVIQREQRGIAHAIGCVERLVKSRFLVALGDCLQVGDFYIPDDMQIGQMAWETPMLAPVLQGNLLLCSGNVIVQSIEKPQCYPGMGTYFLDRRVFPFIAKQLPSRVRGEVEISDVMDTMAQRMKVHVVRFRGEYVNVTYPEDIKRAERLVDARATQLRR